MLAVGGGLVEAEGVSDDGRGGLGDELAERGDPAGAHGEAEAAELVEDRGAVRDMALKFLTTNAAPAYMPIARAGPKLPAERSGSFGRSGLGLPPPLVEVVEVYGTARDDPDPVIYRAVQA